MHTNQIDMDDYKKLARMVVGEGCVLLKNEDNTLPLNLLISYHRINDMKM